MDGSMEDSLVLQSLKRIENDGNTRSKQIAGILVSVAELKTKMSLLSWLGGLGGAALVAFFVKTL